MKRIAPPNHSRLTILHAIRVALICSLFLVAPRFCSGQEESLGDVARAGRAEKSQAQRAGKVITNDDIGPHAEPVQETDDPVKVTRDALALLLDDTGHTCRAEQTDNSGPGSSTATVTEAQGRDRIHMLVDSKGGPNPGHSELIIVGTKKYARFGDDWDARYLMFMDTPFAQIAEIAEYSVKMMGRETLNGTPVFHYGNTYHPGDVSIRTITDDIWIGANDHRIWKVQQVFSESQSFGLSNLRRYTANCTYGPVPDIKPPM